LDYHDLTEVRLYPDFSTFLKAHPNRRIIAFRSQAPALYTEVEYQTGDFLLFGPESVGLPPEIYQLPQIDLEVHLPMRPNLRSMNLTNTASVALFEAWRQLGFQGANS
jgi:tRNA (cytidine/uridine-2'-O-)-methyltransferase